MLMLESYRKIIEKAGNKSAENKKFLEKLRQKKPADLDRVTHALHEKAFEHIDCLQCANCCSTTGPLLLDKDIERLASHFRKSPAEFTTQFLKIDEDGDYVFKSLPCPFLLSDKYCSAYESRPNACREYPHTSQRNVYQKLKITYLNTMICPAVAEVVEGLRKHYTS
jgi:Fe-S-cluster containining protein